MQCAIEFLYIFRGEKLLHLSTELMAILLLSVLVSSLFTTGLGCGLVYAATLTITCQYFDKRRGLALGIVTTGTAASAHHFSIHVSCISCWETCEAKVNICREAKGEWSVR